MALLARIVEMKHTINTHVVSMILVGYLVDAAPQN